MWHFIALNTAILLITGCSATAPGDEDSRCVGRTYPENVKVLMDSRNYEELLPGHSADPTPDVAWTDASCDLNDTVPNPFSTPPYWQHGTGGLCAYQAQVCGYSSSGPQDNWLFTQYISKTPTAADTYAVRVYVNITYQFLSCRERGGCRSVFRLQNYITNSEQQSLTCSQTSQFSGSAIMPSNIITGSSNSETTKTRYFDMTATQDGFYFALQDRGDADLYGTCVAVSRLIIYRHECRAQAVMLVRYPVTQAPASGTVSVTIQCVPNAQRSSSSLSGSCGSDGYWGSERPTCQCDLGYQSATNGVGNQVCNACPVGTYRSSRDTTCLSCPANTLTNQVATRQCQCKIGYFRNNVRVDSTCSSYLSASNERAGNQCTQPPSAPNSVTVSASQSRSMRVSWSRASQSGGRSDVYYTVQHSDPDTLGQFIATTCLSSTATSHIYTGLRPETQYCIRVTAHNGVSDQDPDGTSSRTVQKCESTRLEPPSPVTGFQAFYPVIVWEPPAHSGVITNYKVTFFRGGQSNTYTSVLPHYVIQSSDVPGTSGNFTVQVKAQNSAGLGQGLTGGPSIVSEATCPTATCPTSPPVTSPGAVSVSNITVLGCGLVYWKPPAVTGGEMPGYTIRFFDGQNYDKSQYREIQRYFDDPNRRWAVAANLPSGRTVYVDIRAKNSAGVSSYSVKKVVANPEPKCPTCPPNTTCPPPPVCPTTAAPTECPTVTCPSSPAVTPPELNVMVLVGVLHLTWNPVAFALKYDVIFKEKLEEKGKVHKTITNKNVARINLEDIMQYKEVFVEVIPSRSVVKRSTLNYTSEPVKIDVKQIVNTLNDDGELKLALGQSTDTSVDGTSIAISMLVTFLVTAAIMSFLAISLGLLLKRYYSKKHIAHRNSKFETTQKTSS